MKNYQAILVAIFSALFGTYLFLTRPLKQEPVTPVKPVEKKKDEEVDINDPFYRGPRPDPFKPVSKPKENETQVEADVHQAKPVEPTKPAEVVEIVEPCGDCTKPCTPCVPEETTEIAQEQEEEKPRVSFAKEEAEHESNIVRDETPLPERKEEESLKSASSVSSVSTASSSDHREPTPEPVTQEPVVEKAQTPEPEPQIEEEYIQEEMISPIQRGLSTDSDKVGGMTLDDYEKSKQVAMDHFITEQVVEKVEATEDARESANEIIEEDIIQPISRSFSSTQNTPGKTLSDFQKTRDEDLSNINDEISAALDDLESAQKLLDEKHESEIRAVRQETIDALGDDLVQSVSQNEKVETEMIEDVSEPIVEKVIPIRVDEEDKSFARQDAFEQTTNILSRSLEIDNDVPLLENEEEASTVESVIERELEDDEIDVEIQRVSQIKDESKIDLDEDDLPIRTDSGEPDSVEDMIDFKRTPTDRPSEPTPSAFDKVEQQFFAPSPKEEVDSDEELERELAAIRADVAKNAEIRDGAASLGSEPGDAQYDYVSKDLEPGNDVNNMIEANRDAAEKVEQKDFNVELSPQLSPEPISSTIESEINEIPSVVDEIKSSIEDMSKITGAPQIVKTDVQTFGVDSE